MRRIFVLFLVLVCVAAPAIAAEFSVLTGESNALKDGGTVSLGVGQALHISLGANATTGYAWVCNVADETVVTLLGEGYVMDDCDDPEMTGIGGTQHFFLSALAAGESQIELREKQFWMEESEDDLLRTFTVVVK